MKLVIIIGDTSVGKMTVGQQLVKITKLNLFHNHMSIEPILEIFGHFNGKAINRFREVVFEEYAKTDNYGLIFTYMWAFDQQSDWDYIAKVCEIFKKQQSDVEIIYVELVAPQNIRLQRNTTLNRLNNKPSKKDIDFSVKMLLDDDIKYRCVSNDNEIPFENYIKIDNSNLDADKVATLIKERFNL